MGENLLFVLIITLAAMFLIFKILDLVFKKYSIALTSDKKYPVKELINLILWDKEVGMRVIITIAILVLLRIVFFIPLPGIDICALQRFLERISHAHGQGILSILPKKGFEQLTIFGLGLMPFLSSCVLIQLGSIFIPALRRYSFGGEAGRFRISKHTYIFTIALSIIQSFFLSLWLENSGTFQGFQLVSNPGVVFRVVTVLTMTASVIVLLLIAGLINRYGIGNGIALIAISQFPFNLIQVFHTMYIDVRVKSLIPAVPILAVVFFIIFVYAIFYLTRLKSRVEVKTKNPEKVSITFRPTLVGIAPAQLAVVLFMLPVTLGLLAANIETNRFLSSIFSRNSIFSMVIVPVLVVILTFLYSLIVFKPKYIANLLEQYGFLPAGDSAGIENELRLNMSKVLAVTALFLVSMTLASHLAILIFGLSYRITGVLFGMGIAVVVGVFSDIVAQLGFFKDKKSLSIKEWGICYVAFDEIEAEIIKEYLKTKNIVSLIEPLRYSWGIPIRTIVDQYRIYVPLASKETARSLILEKKR